MDRNTGNETLWTPDDVARFCDVSKSQVFRWVYTGDLPYVRLSERVIRFDPEAVRRWALARKEPRQ